MELFLTYAEMRQQVGEYYEQQSFQDAAEILEWGLTAFPEHLSANVFNLALCRVQLSEFIQAIQTLQYGLDRGVWFGPFEIGAAAWKPISEREDFQVILDSYEALREEAQKNAKPLLEVAIPEDYDPDTRHPLFIALHGGGETVKGFRKQWTSSKMNRDFIVAYPQSSRVISMNGYSWLGEPPDQQEIASAFEDIDGSYAVDRGRVLMGGFSAGGHLALTLLLEAEEVVPCVGFVLLCPPVPDEIPIAAVKRMVDRGQSGVLITTEMDQRLKEQEKMTMVFESAGVPIRFEVVPDLGHWYPEDLGERIDAAIQFIFDET